MDDDVVMLRLGCDVDEGKEECEGGNVSVNIVIHKGGGE